MSNILIFLANFTSIEYFPTKKCEDQYLIYDSLNQNLLLLTAKNRIKVVKRNLKIKFFRNRFFKVSKNKEHLYFVKNLNEVHSLTHIQKGDFESEVFFKLPKKKIVDYLTIGKLASKFLILCLDGTLNLYNQGGKLITKSNIFDAIKTRRRGPSRQQGATNQDGSGAGGGFNQLLRKKDTEVAVTMTVCRGYKNLIIATCNDFPKGKSQREKLFWYKISGVKLSYVGALHIFNNLDYSNLYSLAFYPVSIDGRSVVYGLESGAKQALCSYVLDETLGELKQFKEDVEGYHSDVTWGFVSDGGSLWSVDDSWSLKNLVVQKTGE